MAAAAIIALLLLLLATPAHTQTVVSGTVKLSVTNVNNSAMALHIGLGMDGKPNGCARPSCKPDWVVRDEVAENAKREALREKMLAGNSHHASTR